MNYLTTQQAQDKDLIMQLIQRALPHEKVQDVRSLNGLISHNYQINHHLIFKVASALTMSDKWKTQARLAPVLQKELGCHVPQVQYIQVPLSDRQFVPVCYYEQIAGKCIPTHQFAHQLLSFKEKYFERLAELTYRLHRIPFRQLPAHLQTRQEMAPELLGQTSSFQSKLLQSTANTVLNAYLGPCPDQVLCHTDLHSENVCLNQRGDIVGLLDFDNLCRGPRFMEFTPYLYHPEDRRLWIQKYNQISPRQITPADQKFHQLLLGGFCAWAALGALFQCYQKTEKDKRQSFMRIIQKLIR